MSDEVALRKDMERAARAQALLSDELLLEAFLMLRAQYLAAWEASGALDTDERERWHLGVVLLAKVRGHLEKMITDGQLAASELNRLARVVDQNHQ